MGQSIRKKDLLLGFAARNAKLIVLLTFLCLSYAVIIFNIQSGLGSPLLRRTTGGGNPTFEYVSQKQLSFTKKRMGQGPFVYSFIIYGRQP